MASESCYENLLSQTECQHIVENALEGAILTKYEIVPASSDTIGYLGDYYKLKTTVLLNGTDSRDISFFVKSLPLRNEVHKAVIKRLQFMDKETTLYNLFHKMKKYSNYKWHPEVYLCREDVLVLEDLIQSNYKHHKFNLNLPDVLVWPALKCLAAMHANSIVYEVKTDTNIGADYVHLFNRTITKGNTWVNSGLKSIYTLARMHPKFQTIEYQHFITKSLATEVEKVHQLGRISEQYRNTLCHRDLWENNMMFRNDVAGFHCILVDFQVTRYIPPSIDIGLFLHMNTDRTNRKENLTTYFNYYFDCLTKFTAEMGVNINDQLPRVEFDKTYEEFKLIPLVLTCVYAPIVYLPDFKILNRINKEDPVKFQRIMNGDRSDFTIEHINKFKDYGDRVMEAVEELTEYLFENREQ